MMVRRGQEIEATVTAEIGDDQPHPKKRNRYSATLWQLDSESFDVGWSGKLRSISGKLYEVGDVENFWVWEIDEGSRLILVSDSNFGRATVSDRTRPRYIRGLRAVVAAISGDGELASIDTDDLSEATGLFEKCVRGNQWDWFTVWSLLDFTDRNVLQESGRQVKVLRHSLQSGNYRAVGQALERLESMLPKELLVEALEKLEVSVPALPQVTEGTSGPGARERESTDGHVLSPMTKERFERASAEHASAQEILERTLSDRGYVVERGRHVDVYTRLRSGPAIFEVKSITQKNERSQCRKALSQLYEYRYVHQVPDASLWLVFSMKPSNAWLVPYLVDDRGLNVLWREGESMSGPHLDRLDATKIDSGVSEYEC